MEDIKHLRCPACKRAQLAFAYTASEYRTNDAFEIFECPNCGLGVTRPKLTLKALSSYYAKQYYGSRKGAMDGVINYLWIRKVSRVWRHNPGRLLDIGCGNGSFLKMAAARGWDVYGTELAPDTHMSKDMLSKICRGELHDCPFEKKFFNVITLWHSFEHMQDPEKYIKEIHTLLNANGVLIIEVPNYRSWQARIFKNNWLHLDVPRHVFHFSPESLQILLHRNDFVIQRIDLGDPLYDLFGLLQSFLNTVNQKKNIIFDLFNGKTQNREILMRDRILTAACFIPAAFLSVLLWLGEAVCRKNGTITIYARQRKQKIEHTQ